MDLIGRWVHFRIRDVYIPEPGNLLAMLHGEDLLQGKVVEFTDSGAQPRAFAVVEVEGLEHPVIVPAGSLLGSL